MKIIFTAITAIALFAIPISADIIQNTVSVEYSGMSIDTVIHSSGQEFCKVELPDFFNSAEPNEPFLPVKLITVEVPLYVNNVYVTLDSYSSSSLIKLDKPIYPMENFTTNGEPTQSLESVTYGIGYASTAKQPSVEVVGEYLMDNSRHMVTVEVSPLAYVHDELSLYRFNDIKFSVRYTACDENAMTRLSPLKINKSNSDNPLRSVYCSTSGTLSELSDSASINNYVIFTPDFLKESLSNFAEWKRQKGYQVDIVTYESIYQHPDYKIGATDKCFDNPSSVREWMRDYFRLNGVFYALIVGDFRTNAPIRKFRHPGLYSELKNHDFTNEYDTFYIPSDAYFADLNSEWTITECEAGILVGNTKELTFSPTIPVGRLLCSSPEEIKNFTRKVIIYEIYPGKGDASYLGKGTLARHQDMFTGGNIFKNLTDFDVVTKDSNKAAVFGDLRPFGSEIIELMNESGLTTLQGHGTPITITITEVTDDKMWPATRNIMAQINYKDFDSGFMYENKSGLDNLTNFDRPSIVYSTACTIAPFDNKFSYPGIRYNMASGFTVAGKYGGPLMIANSRLGWIGYSPMLEKEFGKYVKENLTVSIAQNKAKTTFRNSNGLYGKYIIHSSNVIGDGELIIWTKVPEFLNAGFSRNDKVINISWDKVGGM